MSTRRAGAWVRVLACFVSAVHIVVGAGLMAANAAWPKLLVFGFATTDPCAPAPKRGLCHFWAHQSNHFRFAQTKLLFYRLEGRSVLPGHFDDAAGIAFIK